MVWICYSQRRITINLQSIHTNIPAEVKEYQGAVSTTRMHLSCSIRDPPSNQTLAHGPRYARDTNTISSAFIPPASLALKRDYDLKYTIESSFLSDYTSLLCPIRPQSPDYLDWLLPTRLVWFCKSCNWLQNIFPQPTFGSRPSRDCTKQSAILW